jgi:hypothetical protein
MSSNSRMALHRRAQAVTFREAVKHVIASLLLLGLWFLLLWGLMGQETRGESGFPPPAEVR